MSEKCGFVVIGFTTNTFQAYFEFSPALQRNHVTFVPINFVPLMWLDNLIRFMYEGVCNHKNDVLYHSLFLSLLNRSLARTEGKKKETICLETSDSQHIFSPELFEVWSNGANALRTETQSRSPFNNRICEGGIYCDYPPANRRPFNSEFTVSAHCRLH